MTRRQQEFVSAHPSGFRLVCDPQMARAPLGVSPDASNPAVTSDARKGGDRSRTLIWNSPQTRACSPSNQRVRSHRATSCRNQIVEPGDPPLTFRDQGQFETTLDP